MKSSHNINQNKNLKISKNINLNFDEFSEFLNLDILFANFDLSKNPENSFFISKNSKYLNQTLENSKHFSKNLKNVLFAAKNSKKI